MEQSVSDLLDFISPDQDSNGSEAHRKQRRAKVVQISEKAHEAHHDVMVEDALAHDGLKNNMAITESKTEEVIENMVHFDEPEENDDISRYGATISGELVEETTSDEGWQEANPKGRSGNAAGRKFGRRRPVLAKLNVNGSEYSTLRERSNRREIVSPAKKKTPRTATSVFSPMKDSIKWPGKASVSKVSTSPASLNAMASKCLSYKEVAAAPPGTVLKPLLGKVEVSEEKIEIPMCSTEPETLKEEVKNPNLYEPEEIPPSSNQEKPIEKNGSKLSAAAEPFSPGALSMTQPLNSVAVTSIYDVRASQVKNNSSRNNSTEAEKSELARQILLSFIVNSVQHNIDAPNQSTGHKKKSEHSENSADAIANDSAIIKVLYGNEKGKTNTESQSNDQEQEKAKDANKKSGDGEGFIVVRKRRRNRQQFTNVVTDLYNKQSICALFVKERAKE
ncbi:Tetratricopeptide repeat (TPR)-like superfamily protein [Melia azedarach]|uniref:Tetratricopeptide repeat (TPR)-like superfamily protein n=1 Tax=Melia azedarach TaxID=155640 RepID=A0ACC1Y413_MELAZ|nr:Tetratricopeptide repeat (TPR)-like superfamily protein [Melia azedarach]